MALIGKVRSLLLNLTFTTRRTSTFAVTITVGAVFFERVFDQGGHAVFEQMNRGKLWKHNME
uniref:Complex III subunit 9 n=1 Tax=Oryzias sinensis TaxID=183150 RepID=A0A8C7WSW5_9TELE